VVVAVCEEEERVLCEYSHDSRWVDLTSEEICLPNTHFSRELDSLSPQVSGLDGRRRNCTEGWSGGGGSIQKSIRRLWVDSLRNFRVVAL
jgi:hypothetical protein